MNPVVVHVVRPYASDREYLAAEAWSIEARGMLLLDVEPLPVDTLVLFDVTLDDGQKPIRAEARVVGTVAAEGDRPGGLKVRFRRFGAATKAFIERAVRSRTGAQPEPSSRPAASEPSASPPSGASASTAEGDRPGVTEVERESLPEVRASMTDIEAVMHVAQVAQAARAPEESGLQRRVVAPVPSPPNREELLARLRERRRAG